MKYKIESISAGTSIDEVEVQSYEMNIYLVKVTINGESGFIYDKKDNIKRFHNTQQIRDLFEPCHVANAVMVQDSPYDEMIGNPAKQSHKMVMPFSLTQPY